MKKVKYRCKSCGWHKELPSDWADVKPRFCPTPTCEMSVKKSKGKKSFRNNPDMLETTFHETQHKPKEVTITTIEYSVTKPKDEAVSGKEKRSRHKTSEGGAL